VFGEVTATSGGQTGSSSYTQLGDIGGKGVGSSSVESDLSFYCEEDSIILGVQYFMPKGFYDSVGMDPFNSYLQREDFPLPMTENLGLRPIYAKYMYNTGQAVTRNSIMGFTFSFPELKTGIDRNYGLFGLNFDAFAAGTSSNPNPVLVNLPGSLSTFATHVYGLFYKFNQGGTLSADDFKVVPNDLDTIFRVNYSKVGDESTDQFYGWMAIKLSVVNGMSVFGLPSL
jgi:hypothetical protein